MERWVLCFIQCYFFLFFQVSPCLTRLFVPLSNEQKKISKLYMPNLLQFHQCSYSFIMTRVTPYKEHADSCEEHKYHTTSEKMQVSEWPSRESHSCLLGTQITYGHTNTLITKPTGGERIWGKGIE